DPVHLNMLNLRPVERTESRLEALFGIARTVNDDGTLPDPLAETPPSQIEGWRLAYLRAAWASVDQASDPWATGDLPIIDPDLIGPDALRRPGTGEAAFALWAARRAWVDARIAEIAAIADTAGLVARIGQPFAYGAVRATPWPGAPDLATLKSMLDDL